jgi:hypothetical protein
MTVILMNPGSENKGGTTAQAKRNAVKWLKRIHKEFPEVIMNLKGKDDFGDWEFEFQHLITKKKAILAIHGFTKTECKNFTFKPRVYWNGSSTSEPSITDWLPRGWNYKIVYSKKKSKNEVTNIKKRNARLSSL